MPDQPLLSRFHDRFQRPVRPHRLVEVLLGRHAVQLVQVEAIRSQQAERLPQLNRRPLPSPLRSLARQKDALSVRLQG